MVRMEMAVGIEKVYDIILLIIDQQISLIKRNYCYILSD